MTTHIHIALPHNMRAIKCTDHLRGIKSKIVVVVMRPAMRVHEEDNIRQMVVIVDEIGEVNHDLMPFVLGRMLWRSWIVGNVNGYV